jgi:hypothetical protein
MEEDMALLLMDARRATLNILIQNAIKIVNGTSIE